jgi:type I restriction enzyme S subunit
MIMNDSQILKPDWAWVKFSDVVRQVKDKVDVESSALDRYIAGEHMDTDDLRIRRWGTIDDSYLGPAFHMRFTPGQVLYGSRRTYLRKVAVPDFEGICANTTFVLETKDPTILLPELLPFIMQTEAFNEHSVKQSKGSVNPYVNFSDLAWYEFALPTIEEQRRIVQLLQVVEQNLEAIQELEATLEQLRKSFIVSSFSKLLQDDKTRIVKVAQAGDVLMGRQRAPQYDQGISPRPYLRVANVFDGYIDTSDIKKMDFSETEFEQFKLRSGDVLLNEGQSRELVGRSSIFREEVLDCCFQNTLIRFRPRKVSSEYAHHYFQYCLYTGRFITISKQTTSIAHLGANRFASMAFPIPSPNCEQEIAITHSSIETNLRETTKRKENAKKLKRLLFESELFGKNGDGA